MYKQQCQKTAWRLLKKGEAKLSRNNWHDANLLAKTVSDIRLWPSIDYAKY